MGKKKADAATFADPVDRAQAEISRHRDRELEIWRDRRQRMLDLAVLEAETGRVVADGGDDGDAGRRLAEGEAVLRVRDRAADELARQREAAIPTIWRAQAASKRATEKAKRAEVLEREPRTRKMLADLAEWERCPYAPAGRQPGDGGGGINPGSVVVYNLPLTQRLALEADEAGTAAAALERQVLNLLAGGQVHADSIEDLIVEGLGDGQHVFPVLREIERRALVAEQVGRERLQRVREGFGEATPDPETAAATWTLAWQGREITQLTVSFLGLAGSSAIDDYGDPPAGLVQVGERSWMREASAPAMGAASREKGRRRPESDRDPHDVSATAAEIEREAAATGKSVEQVAKEFGVPVPESLAPVAE